MNLDENTFYHVINRLKEKCGEVWVDDTLLNILGRLDVAYRVLQNTQIKNSEFYITLIKRCARLLYDNSSQYREDAKVEVDKILLDIMNEVKENSQHKDPSLNGLKRGYRKC